MSKAISNVFIVGAKRTAIGTYGGKLKNYTPTDLGEIAARAALKHASISPEYVDHIVFGNVIQSSQDTCYLSRHIGLRIGLPVPVPALTVNRLCGSGFEAIIQGVHQIIAGDSKVVLTGGSESMSQPPFVVRGTRFGLPFGSNASFDDVLWQGLTDWHIKTPMGMTAENLGAKYNLTREDVDLYAHKSQSRWRLANNAGYFQSEIEPIKIKTRKGEEVFEVDEHPRETTPEGLGKLPAVFKKDGLVTAGNASGICDGASSVVIASEEAVQKHKLTPMARIVAWSAVGCDPAIMGIGPVYAIQNVIKKSGISLDKIDLIEVNEAFAAQVVSVQRELKIESDRLNVNGGAIAIGHPLAMSGSRISTHLAYELKRRGAKYGIGSACIGGGQGIAILFESV